MKQFICFSILLFTFTACQNTNLQKDVESILQNNLTEVDADSGLVILMNNSGEIEASANLVLTNGEYQKGEFTPNGVGSLFIPVCVMAALEEGLCSMEDTIDTGMGIYKYEGNQVTDHNAVRGGYGEITVEQVIAFSSNVGLTKILEHSPKSINKLGFRNENSSLMDLLSGNNVTPMEIITFYNSIAKGDTKLCSEKTMKEIQQSLIKAVEEGTGKPVESDKVRIAGKTGTLNLGDKHEVSFCGYFPADNPEYTCLVIISNPKNGYPSGGLMAGSVFKEITHLIIPNK